MKKRILSLFCALVLLAGALPSASALQGEAARAADTLATLGLIDTAVSGDYGLNESASRAQAAVLLVALAGVRQEAENDNWISGFTDVPAWARAEITYAAHRGWASGAALTEFKPDSTVTANAWFTFLLRMLGYSDKSGDFAVSGAAVFAQQIGLAARGYSGGLTRGQLYQSAADALTFSYKDGSATVIGRLVERTPSIRAAANALGLMETALTARQVSDRLSAAVFRVDLYEKQKYVDRGTPTSTASGFFISDSGLAVTNYHSIDGGVYATATLSTGETFPVERVLYYDPEIDIAVVKVSQATTDGKTTSAFKYLEMAGTGDVRPGDKVYSLGNPLGGGLAVSEGVVSATEREVPGYAWPCVMNTADISKGSSGGVLMNVYGQAIAVTTGAFAQGNSMYLGVPVDPVMEADLTGKGWTLAEVAKIEQAKIEKARAESDE
ncbi:MAG: serine protease [Oscillibacter sp.]|jgi:S1-C subfamily serine protease|nr:serine protease [uncultured Oscillibacter sp.]MCI8812466.1 serine protease [Oscillibacter sp.]